MKCQMNHQPCKEHAKCVLLKRDTIVLCRVATLILSYFNDTVLNELGDIESYLASYLYKNRQNLTMQAARVASGKPLGL